MSEDSAPPAPNPMAGLADSWRESREGRSKLDRLIEVGTTLEEPTRISTVADRVGCSRNFASDKLELLATLGVLERVSTDPKTYRRDEAHFRRLRSKALRDAHGGDLEAIVKQYQERDRELKAHFGVESPAAVTYEHFEAIDDPDALADERDALSTWQTVRDRLLDLQRAQALDEVTRQDHSSGDRFDDGGLLSEL